MWQEIVVALCVIAAAYFVIRQWLPIGRKKESSCGGCGGCSPAQSCAKELE
jgi:hypothetical protein